VRVAALLPQAGGWQPPALPDDGIDALPQVPAPEPPPSAAADDAGPGGGGGEAADPPRPQPERSWGRSALPSTLRGGRVDPGVRGVAALVLVAVVAAVLTAVVVARGRPEEVAVPAVTASGVPLPGVTASGVPLPGVAASADPTAEVVVAVAGAVRVPGLVRLPAGSRIDDAVRAAGGLQPGASYGLLNLARRLVDGEQVLVGVDPPAAGPAARGAPAAGGLLDLNAASGSDLDALPGIGPVLAQRIVDWRAEHGRFASVDQLREVPGIGESKYADLKDKVAV
jgi:competence protein ComEA